MSKFVYFGTPYVARDTLAALVEAGYVPELVVTSPDAPQGRGLELMPCDTKVWALEHNIPVLTPEKLNEEVIQSLSGYEYGIAVAYGKIMPQVLIDAFPKGILNVHYSLLPKYRGASPVESALLQGETVTGVVVQQMAFQMDAGDILSEQEIPITSDDTTLTLRPKLIEAGAHLLIETLPSFLDGTAPRTKQDEAFATRAPKIRKEQGQLNLAANGLENWNIYRALRESPGTYFFAEKEDKKIRIKITNAVFKDGVFQVQRIVPEGKTEQDFSWLTQAGWQPVSG